MTWLILFGYVLIPLAFVGLWIIDLWAKSYDLPGPQALAKVVLCISAGAVVAACLLLLGFGLQDAEGLGHTAAWVSAAPVIVGLTWVLYDLDWRSVYAVALAIPALVPLVWNAARHDDHLHVGAAVATLVASVAVISQTHPVRLRRYSRQLHRGCWCCGYKQRAIHELMDLGTTGEAAIQQYAQVHERDRRSIAEEMELARGRRTRS